MNRRCPKRKKPLEKIVIRAGTFYGHSYSLAHVMSDKPMCDYSKKEETSGIQRQRR